MTAHTCRGGFDDKGKIALDIARIEIRKPIVDRKMQNAVRRAKECASRRAPLTGVRNVGSDGFFKQ